jgi:hypothetical protein
VCLRSHSDGFVTDRKLDVIQGDINAIYAGEDPYSKVFCDATQRNTAVELLAVVIDKVDGFGDASRRVAAFARGIHDRFGVGSAACGSGAVVVVSVEDRQVLHPCCCHDNVSHTPPVPSYLPAHIHIHMVWQ